MGITIISEDGRFEWDKDKSRLNRKKHGFSFDEILEVFDDPAFLEGYDVEHSIKEERYYGIGRINNILCIIVFYTYPERNLPASLPKDGDKDSWVKESEPFYMHERRRIFSARRADKEEQGDYDEYFKKAKS